MIGGKGPAGKDGVTRPAGAALGAGASPLSKEGVVKEGNGVPAPVPPAKGATQLTAPPPFVPEQDHVHGPLPLTALAMPAEHKALFGTVMVGTPLDAPHAPTIGGGGINGAVQLTVMPPLEPMQLQFQGPSPLTAVAAPVEHKPSFGVDKEATPFTGPHKPLTFGPGGGGAFGTIFDVPQVLAMPPFRPEQVHVQGPSP